MIYHYMPSISGFNSLASALTVPATQGSLVNSELYPQVRLRYGYILNMEL